MSIGDAFQNFVQSFAEFITELPKPLLFIVLTIMAISKMNYQAKAWQDFNLFLQRKNNKKYKDK